jgi:protoporphyrinogen oxidase
MNKDIYDYIIIGGGISGLYSLHLLNKLKKNLKILLIEKEDYLGGRILNKKFHNNIIRLGAGIAKDDNKHLFRLLKKLNIKSFRVQGDKRIVDPNFDKSYHLEIIKKIKDTVKNLKNNNINYSNLTVKQFLKKYLDPEEYSSYIKHIQYGEYLDGDINYYINNDPMYDDNVVGKFYMNIINWDLLIKRILANSKKSQIKKNCSCKNIEKIDEYFIINTDQKKYISKKIILAVTINVFDKITSRLDIHNYSKFIGSLPFSRIYTYHRNGHNFISEKTGSFNIMFNNNHLHKIIIMNDKIIMASYTNGSKSKFWNKIKSKTKLLNKVDQELKKIIPTTNNVDDIIFKYWDEGVHFYKPLGSQNLNKLIKNLQNPIENFYVVGEMLSNGHGWVDGAIESVDNIYRFL